jgi:hypothetical protein
MRNILFQVLCHIENQQGKKNKCLPNAVIILSIHTKKALLFSGSDLHNWLPMDWKILNFMIKTQGPTAGQREIKTRTEVKLKLFALGANPKKK